MIPILLLAAARFLDLLTTWLVSPTLEHELNPILRKLGWRLIITLNLLVLVSSPLWTFEAIIVCTVLSLCASLWNLANWLKPR